MRGNPSSAILEHVPLRCVIVDDNPGLLRAAGALLEREGVAVVGVASTTAEALELIREQVPDLALIDIDLGGESGFDLANRLARNGPTPSILISTYCERDFTDLIEASPALGFVSKSNLSAKAIHQILGDQP
jgi:DNA-binding NarL/FixJ family response regulator